MFSNASALAEAAGLSGDLGRPRQPIKNSSPGAVNTDNDNGQSTETPTEDQCLWVPPELDQQENPAHAYVPFLDISLLAAAEASNALI
jgi:hypothetical protein